MRSSRLVITFVQGPSEGSDQIRDPIHHRLLRTLLVLIPSSRCGNVGAEAAGDPGDPGFSNREIDPDPDPDPDPVGDGTGDLRFGMSVVRRI